jgi:predicted transposase YbfD/YdcC
MQPLSVWTYFESLEDPRVLRTRRHKLMDIVVISVMAVVSFADGWEDIVDFAKLREAWLRTFLELPNGIPCPDTFRRVFTALNPLEFQACFQAWVRALVDSTHGKLVAIDGKTVRHSFAREEGKGPLHVVSAWVAQNQLVLGQIATEAKSNEITAIPKLLELIDVRGATVTTDAMGCEKKIAEAIVEAGGNYVLALKDNQPTLHQEVELFFESARAQAFRDTPCDQAQSVDGDHGRIELRRVFASDDIGWMSDKAQWVNLKSVVMVESERTVGQETSLERRYYLTSHSADAKVLAELIQGHWGIENKLHWVLDMAFDEDRCRIRRGNAPDNFALLRKIALNQIKLEKTNKRGVEAKRKRAAWDHGYLLTVLQAVGTMPA